MKSSEILKAIEEVFKDAKSRALCAAMQYAAKYPYSEHHARPVSVDPEHLAWKNYINWSDVAALYNAYATLRLAEATEAKNDHE